MCNLLLKKKYMSHFLESEKSKIKKMYKYPHVVKVGAQRRLNSLFQALKKMC